MSNMRDVSIERLALRVTGLDEGAARVLARVVAERLAAGLEPAAGETVFDHLDVTVHGGGHDLDALGRRIVDAIGRRLARDRVSGGPGTEGTA